MRGLSKFERRLIGACLILMLLSLGVMLLDDGSHFGDRKSASQERIGAIRETRRDVRRKGAFELQWRDARRSQDVYVGDSVFAGENSDAVIDLDGKNELRLSPNSLVRFSNIQGFKVGDMSLGTFRVQVDGELKVAINGQLRTFKGEKSEVEVVIKRKGAKPSLRVTKGDVRVNVPAPVSPPAMVVRAEVPVPRADQAERLHVWTLGELYAIEADAVRPKTPPREVSIRHVLEWEGGNSDEFGVQISETRDFAGRRHHFTSTETTLPIDRAFVGENFWRVSADRKRWSEPASFTVRTAFLDEVMVADRRLIETVILDRVPTTRLQFSSGEEIRQMVVEFSRDPGFAGDTTRVMMVRGLALAHAFAEAGSHFVRARGMNAYNQLTEFSAPVEVRVEIPAYLPAPDMPIEPLAFDLFADPIRRVSWSSVANARAYDVEILNAGGAVLHRQRVRGQTLSVGRLSPGDYAYRVLARDRWGRPGQPSLIKDFVVRAPPPAPLLVETPPPPALIEREIAQAVVAPASSILSLDRPAEFKNMMYGDSRLAIEGATFGMLSSEQSYADRETPYAAMITVRGRHWIGNWGGEAAFRSKVFAVNQEGGQVSPWNFEARALRGWRFRGDWIPLLREFRVAAILGGEIHRNRNTGLYASGYDLLKVGGNIEFPLFESFSSGGEIIYGTSADASTKMEISGFLNYFLKKQWAIGGGYRVHLFEAGSLSSSPGILPYREGYVEGYSSLRYSY